MSWQLFDRVGAYFKKMKIYRSENIFTDQSSLMRIIAGNDFINFSSQNALLQQTNLQINRLERYKDFDQMDEVGEITLALDMYADEASLIDPERKHTLMVRAKRNRVKDELEDLFYNTLMIDNFLRPAIRYLCKYGDLPLEIIPTKHRDGVQSIRHMNIYNFTRVETKFGDLVGFFYQDELSQQPTFFHPWQIAHLRLTSFENIYHPYGRAVLDGARKHFKQLRLMEDAALVYRITRAPEKRVFTIPVGNIPTKDVPQYMELIAREFKKKKFFDPSSGDVNERWSPLIQEDDFWMPQRADGNGPTVDTLPGAENLDQIADIEYFKKKMIAALKIPFSRVGIGEPDESSRESLSKSAPEFAKAVQWIQREVAICLKKIAMVHLALRGYTADDMRNFDLVMTASSAIDELYRMEVWASRADVIEALKSTELFPDDWILRRFTDMTDDEIDQMMEDKERRDQEMLAAGSELGIGGGGFPPDGMGAPPGAPPLPALEGLDIDLEQMVLSEFRGRKNKKRRQRFTIKEEYFSGFDSLMNTGEFDALPYDKDENGKDIIVESIIVESERKSVIEENKRLLLNESIVSSDDGEVKMSDLP